MATLQLVLDNIEFGKQNASKPNDGLYYPKNGKLLLINGEFVNCIEFTDNEWIVHYVADDVNSIIESDTSIDVGVVTVYQKEFTVE